MDYTIDIKVLVKHWALVPNEMGIYAFYNSADDCVYIGKAINLHERIRQHVEGDTNTKEIKHHFRGIACIFIGDRDTLEKYLIEKHRPIYNVQYNLEYTERYNDEHILPEIVDMRTKREKEWQKRFSKSMETFSL